MPSAKKFFVWPRRERKKYSMTLHSIESVEKDGWIPVSLELKKLDVNLPCLMLTLPWVRLRGFIVAVNLTQG